MEEFVVADDDETTKRSSIKELKVLIAEDNLYNIFAI